eukprot:356948-Chlamydomonas_euryale.AAC.2
MTIAAPSTCAQFRVRRDHYKGMTGAEVRGIEDALIAQLEDNKARAAARAADEGAYARTQRDVQRTLSEQARQVGDFRAAQARAAAGVLRSQMAEKAARDAANKELYANSVNDAYFQQFGTSHR